MMSIFRRLVKNNNIILLLTLFCIHERLHSEVVILIDIPTNLLQFIKQLENQIHNYVKDTYPNNHYLFEKATDSYEPHITLRYVTNQKVTLEELQEKQSPFLKGLTELIHQYSFIDESNSLKNLGLKVWQGSSTAKYQSQEFHNYAILVAGFDPSLPLQMLAKSINTEIEKYSFVQPQKFPFDPHVTLGYVYDKKDKDVNGLVAELMPIIEDKIASFKKNNTQFVIDSVTLSDCDNKHMKIRLLENSN